VREEKELTTEGVRSNVSPKIGRDDAPGDARPEGAAHELESTAIDDEWRALQPNRRLQAWTLQEGLLQELHRCRRSGRPFVLMRMTVRAPAQRRRPNWPLRHRGTALPDGESVRALFRRIDSVWQHKRAYAVLLAECDRSKAARVVERIQEALAAQNYEAQFALAVFPEDGLTTGALLRAVAQRSEAMERSGRRLGQSALPDALRGRLSAEGVPAGSPRGRDQAARQEGIN
jgi:hypothetical protein